MYDDEGLKLTSEILTVNPECYSMWNYRRRALAYLFQHYDQSLEQKQQQLEQQQQQQQLEQVPSTPSASDAEASPTTEDLQQATPASNVDIASESKAYRIKYLKNELTFTEECVRRNPKSYWIFNQREWATSQLDAINACDWRREFELCALMLKYDSRNCMLPARNTTRNPCNSIAHLCC
jgi:hypothetical protein